MTQFCYKLFFLIFFEKECYFDIEREFNKKFNAITYRVNF